MISFKWKIKKSMCWFVVIIVTGVVVVGCMIVQPVLFTPDIDPTVPDASADNLQQYVRKLSEEYYPRSFTYLGNLNKCAEYIKSKFDSTKASEVFEHTFKVRGQVYKNVIARFKGNPQSNSWIIVGAHYDSYDDTPGADDNASGVAGVLELSRLLSEKPLPVNIELVACTLEEPPFFKSADMGSYHHAAVVKANKIDLKYALIFEMIGRFSDESGSQSYPIPLMKMCYPSKGNFIGLIGNFSSGGLVRKMKVAAMKGTELPIRSINAPGAIPGVDFSDHWSYWQFGYKAVMLSDTAFYRHGDYHELEDTWEKLDYVRMAQVVEMAYSILKNVN